MNTIMMIMIIPAGPMIAPRAAAVKYSSGVTFLMMWQAPVPAAAARIPEAEKTIPPGPLFVQYSSRTPDMTDKRAAVSAGFLDSLAKAE